MDKSVPDPPPKHPPTKPSPTTCSETARRSIAPSISTSPAINPHPRRTAFLQRQQRRELRRPQLYIADLLRCASVTAYQCGDHLKGADRAMVFSVWHLLEIAKAMVDRSIECLGMKHG
jgi:hypothetical protein